MLDFKALGWCALVAIIAWVLIDLFGRLRDRCFLRRFIRRMQSKLERGVKDRPRLLPESLYVVQISDFGVSCTNPDGTVESVSWDDLQYVEIVTTDHGPFLPDVFWLFHGSKAACVVPQGASGDRELLERLQQLPGFRYEAVIDAMSSTDNRRFLCWEKLDASEQNTAPDRLGE